mmetsp:Transcript_19553/g.51815  ORF Transcript_19553/g.51815 Transcript_19553/m.51815 type:complete len:216 (+) Transcript_19553:265-912(+)
MEAELDAPSVVRIRRQDLDGAAAHALGLAGCLRRLVDDGVHAVALRERLHLDVAAPGGRLPHPPAVLFEGLLQERLEVRAIRLHEVHAVLAEGGVLAVVARQLVREGAEEAGAVGLHLLEAEPAGLEEVLLRGQHALPLRDADNAGGDLDFPPELRLLGLGRLPCVEVHGRRLLLRLAPEEGAEVFGRALVRHRRWSGPRGLVRRLSQGPAEPEA